MKIFPARASLLASLVAVVTMGLIASAARTPQGSSASRQGQRDWPAYGGAPENNHYSTLAHINRSEEHTSELQSHLNLVCRLLLEKKKKKKQRNKITE